MSARRLRARSWMGLAFAVVSSGLLAVFPTMGPSNDGSLLGLWFTCTTIGPLLSITAAVLAALAVLGPVKTSVIDRITVPSLAGLASAAGCYLCVVVTTSWFWTPIHDLVYYPDGAPYDWAPVIIGIVGTVLYLVAATLYGFAGKAQGVPVGARTGLLVLLLLAMVPFANILGIAGLTIATYARTSPNGPFLRLRGESTRQY